MKHGTSAISIRGCQLVEIQFRSDRSFGTSAGLLAASASFTRGMAGRGTAVFTIPR